MLAIFSLCFSSCNLTWNENLNSFLEERISSVALKDYSISGYYREHNGKIYLSCKESQTITFHLRNIKKKEFEAHLNIENFDTTTMSSVTVTSSQDKVQVYIPDTILQAKDVSSTNTNGTDIPLTLTINEKETGAILKEIVLPLTCNTPPAKILDAVVVKNKHGGFSVLFKTNYELGSGFTFNAKATTSYAQDVTINTLSENTENAGTLALVPDGFTISNTGETIQDASNITLYTKINKSFPTVSSDANEKLYEYRHNYVIKPENILYTITLTNTSGLSSVAQCSTRVAKITDAPLLDEQNTVLEAEYTVETTGIHKVRPDNIIKCKQENNASHTLTLKFPSYALHEDGTREKIDLSDNANFSYKLTQLDAPSYDPSATSSPIMRSYDTAPTSEKITLSTPGLYRLEVFIKGASFEDYGKTYYITHAKSVKVPSNFTSCPTTFSTATFQSAINRIEKLSEKNGEIQHYIQLTKDITETDTEIKDIPCTISISGNYSLTLKSVEATGRLKVSDETTLNAPLTVSENYYKFYNNVSSRFIVKNGGTLEMLGGSISGSKLSTTQETMGGGVHIEDGGTFIMEEGSIKNCSAKYGGGVYIAGGGKMYMSQDALVGDDTVTTVVTQTNCSNEAEQGGGIYVAPLGELYLGQDTNGRQVTLNKGVCGNYAKDGGGIYIALDTSDTSNFPKGKVCVSYGKVAYNGCSASGNGSEIYHSGILELGILKGHGKILLSTNSTSVYLANTQNVIILNSNISTWDDTKSYVAKLSLGTGFVTDEEVLRAKDTSVTVSGHVDKFTVLPTTNEGSTTNWTIDGDDKLQEDSSSGTP